MKFSLLDLPKLFFITLILMMTACSDDGGIEEKELPTPIQKFIPIVKTEVVLDINATSAKSGGNSINDGNATILKKGVCWSLESSPTINDNISSDGNGGGNFESTLESLSPYTTYYVRAYATNSEGTGYGNEITFRTKQVTLGRSAIVLKTIDGGKNWISISVENMARLRSSFFVDDQTWYVAGEMGTINKTTDGGETWELQSFRSCIFESIFFIDKNNGYAVANNGTIVHTKDGGIIWEEQEWDFNKGLNSVYFTDLNNGISVGPGGYVLKTTDGGVKWETIYSSIVKGVANTVIFTNENTGFAGSGTRIIKTTDGGLNWVSSVSTGHTIHDFHVLDQNVIYAVGFQGLVFKTEDGGETWGEMTKVPVYRLRSVFFVDANIGYVSGDHGVIFKTTDGGQSWNEQNTGVVQEIRSIQFLDENTGFAFGLLD